MRDDWYGHRDPFTGNPVGDREEWLEWDFLLLDTLQIIEDSTDEYGLLAWEVADEAVEVDARKRIHKFRAAIDRATSGSANKPYKPQPGEYFVPQLFSRRSDDSIQTRREWIEKMAVEGEKDSGLDDDSW